MEDIIENKVDMLFGITEALSGATRKMITSKKRHQNVALPRNIIGYMLHNELGVTVVNSGKIINRDHSTITHYTKTFENNYNYYTEFKELYTNISEIFWSNFLEAHSCDIDIEVKNLQILIDRLEQKKINLLTKNN
tara:strand:- start:76 stop:483 length:408 start_codon:yes stop_codon:yes gene_type:complete